MSVAAPLASVAAESSSRKGDSIAAVSSLSGKPAAAIAAVIPRPAAPTLTARMAQPKLELVAPPPRDANLRDPELFLNRELSLLEFNGRVLELARDPAIPLLERLRFLCICSTNLDEFFEIRVAGLKQQLEHGVGGAGADGLDAAAQLQAIETRAHALVG